MTLNKDLGFTAEDRREGCRRGAETARLLNEQGMIVIAAFVSPYESIRTLAKDVIGQAHYLEVHIDAPVSLCMERDRAHTSGVYQKAEQGKIRAFTGISASYVPPTDPFLKVETDKHGVQDCVTQIIQALENENLL